MPASETVLTVADAIKIAWNIRDGVAQGTPPTPAEALAIIEGHKPGFNWLTGAAAIQVLKAHLQNPQPTMQTTAAPQVEAQDLQTLFDLLREARDKIDVAGGIVDWTSEDAEDSGEEYFGQSVCDRIAAMLTKYRQ